MAAPQRVEIGLHAGHHAPRAQLGRLIGGDHLQVLQAVTAAGHRGHAEVVDHAFEGGDGRRDRGVTDDVETRRHAGLGTRPHVRGDGLGIQVAGSDRSGASA